jgi:hypothetical protein
MGGKKSQKITENCKKLQKITKMSKNSPLLGSLGWRYLRI